MASPWSVGDCGVEWGAEDGNVECRRRGGEASGVREVCEGAYASEGELMVDLDRA